VELREELPAGDITRYRQAPVTRPNMVEIHGQKRSLEAVRVATEILKRYPFYWERKLWLSHDVVYERNGSLFSFDLSLAQDAKSFPLVKGGFKKDHCAVCGWELYETDDASHGVAFTNGAVWVCEECYRYFIVGGYFSPGYSDIT